MKWLVEVNVDVLVEVEAETAEAAEAEIYERIDGLDALEASSRTDWRWAKVNPGRTERA